MSTDRKQYRRTIPVEHSADVEQLRWLTRESFDQLAAAEGLRIEEYGEAVVPADQIPAALGEQLPLEVSEYEWREFTAVAVRLDPEPADPVCGYCGHPPHQGGECTGSEPEWTVHKDAEPGPCRCVGDAL